MTRRDIARIAVALAVTTGVALGSAATAEAGGPPVSVPPGKNHGCGYVTTGQLWWKKTVWRCW